MTSIVTTHLTQVMPSREVWRAASPPRTFFSVPGAGYARAGYRKMDLWGDVVSPNPSLRKVSNYMESGRRYVIDMIYRTCAVASSAEGLDDPGSLWVTLQNTHFLLL